MKLMGDVTELFRKNMEGIYHREGCMMHFVTNEARQESDADMVELVLEL